jgi:hypothetical protein
VPVTAASLHAGLQRFLTPLLAELDAVLDARLVRTLLATVTAILAFRNRPCGLLLSELGAYLAPPAHAPAGTKRLANLLASAKWQATVIERWLWQRAMTHVATLEAAGEPVYVVWDESVLEKPESPATPDLCPVRSSKAKRLSAHRRWHGPPGPPVCVRGLHWLGVLVLGRSGPPSVAAMRWWTTRGDRAQTTRDVGLEVLAACAATWGRRVVHVWDRGYAGTPWLRAACAAPVCFVVRWPRRYHLLGLDGQERAAGAWGRRLRSRGFRDLWDPVRHARVRTGIASMAVRHPAVDAPLWLVIVRRKGNHDPWYLLTTEPADDLDAAWAVARAYARRWQIEHTWRYAKAELAMESPRLWTWERRQKLLLLATLAYAFLLLLAAPQLAAWRAHLVRQWCHRTGRHQREADLPLYRLRSAISRLILATTDRLGTTALLAFQNSG